MTTYSIRHTETHLLEPEDDANIIILPVDETCTAEQILSEIKSILSEFHPDKNFSSQDIAYAVFSAFPSWLGCGEEVFAVFEIEDLP